MNQSQDGVAACLARVREREGDVQAWQFLDEVHAMSQARERDAARAAGGTPGLLHGMSVGVKDIIDTADMPTENGTPLHAGRRPAHDAWVVSALRAAGAVILGKTVTTELATYSPGKTRNPHDASRTPGGSSSGSAAAVAAGMVELALGTQTNGSVIRPAAFCGVWGFKPTHGLVPRTGVLMLSRTLDTVGWFANSLEHVALAAEVLSGWDSRDPDSHPHAHVAFREVLAQEPAMPPRIGLMKTPLWNTADAAMREAVLGLAGQLGDACEEVPLPGTLHDAWDWHRTIMESEMAFNLAAEWERGRAQLSQPLQGQLDRGRATSALAYQRALAEAARLQVELAVLMTEFDAILTPSAAGAAPPLATTGDPSFCTLWSIAGMPALNMPIRTDADSMPLGVQLVGRRGDDARLLRTARWVAERASSARR